VIDANALGQRRRGRRPKPNKRVPLSLLLDPEIRSILADSAKENGRSITRQTELILRRGIRTYAVGGPVTPGTYVKLSDNETIYLDKIVNRSTGTARAISDRAAAFLDINYTGRSKDERIARDLGISPGMAKLLRQGRAWTVARLDQALELWPEFRGFVFPAPRTDEIANQLEELAAGLGRLADEFAELRKELRAERAS
jgi:hypothetical protein